MGAGQSGGAERFYGGGATADPYEGIRASYVEGGGCDCLGYVGGDNGGGLKDIKGYSASAAARSKDEIIRAVVETIGSMVGSGGLPSDPAAALEELRTRIPDPKKNGKSFQADAAAQEKVCTLLADGFNKAISPGRKGHKRLIDTDGEPAYVCRAVAELVDGLATGMRAEFLDIQAELRRLVRNMEILLGVADDQGRVVEGALDGADSAVRREAQMGLDRGAKALGALRHQLETLRLTLNTTVADAEREMELALREKDTTIGDVLKGVGLEPGSKLFSDNIAGTMVGLGAVASIAKELNEALKKVGMSVGAFFDAASWKDVEAAADAAARGAPDKTGEILASKDVLHKYFSGRGRKGLRAAMGGADDEPDDDNVETHEFAGYDAAGEAGAADEADAADGIVGGWGESYSGSDAATGTDFTSSLAKMGAGPASGSEFATGLSAVGAGEGFVGGADSDSEDPATAKLTRALKKQRKEKTLIVKDFVRKLHKSYSRLLAAIKTVGPQIGKTVPVSSNLRQFADAIGQLGASREKQLELALIGYYPDSAEAHSLRSSFLGALTQVGTLAGALASAGAGAGAFEEIRSAIADIEKTIMFYGDVLAKREGAGEERGVTGGAPTTLSDMRKMEPVLNSTVHTIKEAIHLIRYHTFLAGVRSNIDRAAEEIESYGEGYAEVLGDAVAERLENDGENFEKILKALKKLNTGEMNDERAGQIINNERRDNVITQYADALQAGPTAVNWDDVAGRKVWSDIKRVAIDRVQAVRKAKADMYRVAQAVDISLHAFTKAALKAPDSVIRDLKRTLDDTKLIARWYTDETGNEIAAAFEDLRTRQLIGGAGGRSASTDPNPRVYAAGANDRAPAAPAEGQHYYQTVSDADLVSSRAGGQLSLGGHFHPQLMVEADFDRVEGHVRKSLEGFSALKNLVNAFARIGSAARGSTFMSPAQIYRTLVNYLQVSAFRTPSASGFRDYSRAMWGAGDSAVTAEDLAIIQRCCHFCFAPTFRGTDGDAPLSAMGFDQTNELFFVTVKAMVAKVMSVLNLYDMLEKPSPLGGLAPVRMILGGGAKTGGASAEVIAEAAGLYFHLPRLAEFYVDLFLRRHNAAGIAEGDRLAANLFAQGPGGASPPWAGGDPGKTGRLIMLVPDTAGTFAELIKLYFMTFRREGSGPLVGQYGVGDADAVISAINGIYRHYAGKGSDVVGAACRGFVAEVNRRYGVVSKTMWEKMKELYDEYETRDGNPGFRGEGATNYAILPDEDDEGLPESRPAPSDAYALDPAGRMRAADGRPLKPRRHRFHLAKSDWGMIQDLREAVSNYFAGAADDGFSGHVVFADVIEAKSAEIGRARDGGKKLALAIDLLNQMGAGAAGISGGLWMEKLVFHETVLLPLGALQRIATFFAWYQGAVFRFAVRDNAGGDLGAPTLRVDLPRLIGIVQTINASAGLASAEFTRSTSAPVLVDFGPLQKLTEELVSSVRSGLAKWRGRLDTETLNQVQGVQTGGNYPVGSLGWFDTWLVSKVFRGREHARATQNELNLNKVTARFVARAKAVLDAARTAGNENVCGTAVQVCAWHVRGTGNPQGVINNEWKLPEGVYLEDQRMNGGRLIQGNALGPLTTGAAWEPPAQADSRARSIFWSFNRVVAQVLLAGYDPATRKIYSGLVRDLATGGPLAEAVSLPADRNNGRLDDFNRGGGAAIVNLPNIAAGAVDRAKYPLTYSIAVALKRLGTDVSRDGSAIYLAESLADVTDAVKERLRAVLPLAIVRFKQVQSAARTLDLLIQRQLSTVPTHLEASKTVLGKIQESCLACGKVMERVLGELGDRPSLLEIRPGFAESYRARFGKAPLAPASFAFGALVPERIERAGLVPKGTPDMNMLFGVRGLYHGDGRGGLAGAGELIQAYKGTNRPSADSYGKLLGNLEQFFRFADGVGSAFEMFGQNAAATFENIGMLGNDQLARPLQLIREARFPIAGGPAILRALGPAGIEPFPLREAGVSVSQVINAIDSESQQGAVQNPVLQGTSAVAFKVEEFADPGSALERYGTATRKLASFLHRVLRNMAIDNPEGAPAFIDNVLPDAAAAAVGLYEVPAGGANPYRSVLVNNNRLLRFLRMDTDRETVFNAVYTTIEGEFDGLQRNTALTAATMSNAQVGEVEGLDNPVGGGGDPNVVRNSPLNAYYKEAKRTGDFKTILRAIFDSWAKQFNTITQDEGNSVEARRTTIAALQVRFATVSGVAAPTTLVGLTNQVTGVGEAEWDDTMTTYFLRRIQEAMLSAIGLFDQLALDNGQPSGHMGIVWFSRNMNVDDGATRILDQNDAEDRLFWKRVYNKKSELADPFADANALHVFVGGDGGLAKLNERVIAPLAAKIANEMDYVGAGDANARWSALGIGRGHQDIGNNRNMYVRVNAKYLALAEVLQDGAQDNNFPALSVALSPLANRARPGDLLQTGVGPDVRQKEVRASIIDLNIVPVNVHALMRGVPLATLFNYAFTFEEMGAAALGTTRAAVRSHLSELQRLPENVPAGALAAPNLTSRDAFLDLLMRPQQILGYGALSGAVTERMLDSGIADFGGPGFNAAQSLARRADRYFGLTDVYEAGLMTRIARGQDNLRMGRPKFFSDQLYGKVLLGNVWPSVEATESDPEAERGAAGVLSATGAVPRAVSAMIWQTKEGSRAHRGRHGPSLESANARTNVQRQAIARFGRERFDTFYVRSLTVVTMIQRLMRYHLMRALAEDRSVIVPSHSLVVPRMTEFATGETLDEAEDFAV